MTHCVLLTGTRAPATLDLARRLHREGVRVIGADSMRFPLGRFSNAFAAHYRVLPPRQNREGFLHEIAVIAKHERVDVIWPTCEEVFHLAQGREVLNEISRVLCPSMPTLEMLHHKLRFAEWTHQLGDEVKAPASWPASAVPVDERLVWKPCYSRFASRTSFERPPGDLAGWMVQRRVRGREFCTWALCVDGEVRTLAQYVCPVRSGRGAGCAFEPVWSDAAQRFTAIVARALNYSGSLAFDFMESDEDRQTYVLECNPRLTSGVHVLSPEVSIRALLDGELIAHPDQRAAQLLLPVLASSPRYAGKSRDVMASSDDPRPAWGQMLAVAEFLGIALRLHISLLESTTFDIEYNGPEHP